MTADLRRLVKKLWRYSKYPSLYTRQRNYKKTECLRREGYISPLCSAYPPEPLVTPWCMLGPMAYGRLNHSCNISAQPVQGLGKGATVTPNSRFPILSDHDPYNS